MSLGLTDNLRSLVTKKYSGAKASGALTFASSHLTVVQIGGVSFQLRYCPALAKKPKSQDKKAEKPPGSKPSKDPFDTPPHDLLVAEVPQEDPTHIVVLNKFPIIPNHVILATKTNKQQTHRLEQDDLECAYQCVKEWESSPIDIGARPRLYAFFNSGQHSGASQAHRHLQFLPVEDMEGSNSGQGWNLLVDNIMAGISTEIAFKTHPGLPFVHFGATLPSSPSSAVLYQTYLDLYQAALAKVEAYARAHPNELELHASDDGRVPISYNLAVTTESMVICPRRNEGQMVKRQDGSDLDFVGLNGTLLAGTLMVKNEELFELLKREPQRLEGVLKTIGIPLSTLINAQI